MKNYFKTADSGKQYKQLKRLIDISLALIFAICTSAFADENLLNLTAPTKIVVSESSVGLRVELPAVNSTCTYGFLEEGLRGIIDCPGKFPSFSKTLPVKTNDFVKQVRIGIHPDKLRVVLDLKQSLTASSNISKSKNIFTLPGKLDDHAPGKPNLIGKVDVAPEVPETPTARPTSSPSPTSEPTAKPTLEPTRTPAPTEIPTKTPTLTPSISPKADPAQQSNDKQTQTSEELPLSLEALQVTFNEGDRLIKDVLVTNNSASQRVVSVDCYVEQNENSGESVLGSLTPSPRRFTLGSDQKRAIRFILALNDDSLRADHEISFVARFSDEYGEMLAPKISFTYLPKQLLPKLVSTPVNGKLKLTNSGNAGVELSSGKCCRLDDCQAVNLTHLAAGKSVILDVSEDCQLEFVREFRGSFQKFKVSREIINDASR